MIRVRLVPAQTSWVSLPGSRDKAGMKKSIQDSTATHLHPYTLLPYTHTHTHAHTHTGSSCLDACTRAQITMIFS